MSTSTSSSVSSAPLLLLLLLLLLVSALCTSAFSSQYDGSTSILPPYPTFPPDFDLIGNVSLAVGTSSIAVWKQTTLFYCGMAYTNYWTSLIYSVDLSSGAALPTIDLKTGASAFPNLPNSPLAGLVRVDGTGRLHVFDYLNGGVITLYQSGKWASFTPLPDTAGGSWTFDISPDGETYYFNLLASYRAGAYQRGSGDRLQYFPPYSSGSTAFAPDGTQYLALCPGSAIGVIAANGTVLSAQPLDGHPGLCPRALVVDASGTVTFNNAQGSNINDLCHLFPSGNISCWTQSSGYNTALAIDTQGVVSDLGAWQQEVVTFAVPMDPGMEEATEPWWLRPANALEALRPRTAALPLSDTHRAAIPPLSGRRALEALRAARTSRAR